MTLNELIDKNYNYILKACKDIAKGEAEDLLNDTYIVIHNKKGFELPSDNDGAVKYFIKCLHNQYKLYNSSFNIQKRGAETVQLDDREIAQEIESEFNQEAINEFKSILEDHERLFYELHYEERVSLMEIAREFRKIGMDRNIINKINEPITKKIKQKWKQ